jgi:hypothetical protein
MKISKSILLFTATTLVISSCFNPPEFPITPKIEFKDIYFRQIGSASDPDSLVVVIGFKDGDGDLGLGDAETVRPYHEHDFFLDNQGKLITVRTRKKPGHENLPAFTKPFDCLNYLYTTINIPESQSSVIDNSYNIVDTITRNGTKFFVVTDTFYVERNPNHYNFTVRFYQLVAGEWQEFDWRTIYPYPRCGETWDGRFPYLTRDGRKAPLEGNLTYGMQSTGFLPLFGSRKLKLRIRIKDRALNESEEIETPEFTLPEIRR